MDHLFAAFHDELEKISARVPRRFLKGPNPFSGPAGERVQAAKYLKNLNRVPLKPQRSRAAPTDTREVKRGLEALTRDQLRYRQPSSFDPASGISRTKNRILDIAKARKDPEQSAAVSRSIRDYMSEFGRGNRSMMRTRITRNLPG